MSNKVFTAIGSSCIDVYYSLERIPEAGDKVNGSFKQNIVGGMIGNAAAVMSGYGNTVYMIDYLSDSEETKLLTDDLERYHISLEGISVSNIYRNAKCLILLENSGERSIIVLNEENPPRVLSDKQQAILLESDFVYSTITDIRRLSDLDLFLKIKKNSGFKLALDIEEPGITGPDDWEVLEQADIIFINEKAHARLSEIFTFDKLKKAIDLVVVTLGEKGSVTYKDSEKIVHLPKKVEVVDTTGAGDTYNASYLHGLSKGWSLDKCGEFATIAASEKITRIGPRSGVRTEAEILHLLSRK